MFGKGQISSGFSLSYLHPSAIKVIVIIHIKLGQMENAVYLETGKMDELDFRVDVPVVVQGLESLSAHSWHSNKIQKCKVKH